MQRTEVGLLIHFRGGPMTFLSSAPTRSFTPDNRDPAHLVEALNLLGAEGWEPVGFDYTSASPDYRVLLKRELPG